MRGTHFCGRRARACDVKEAWLKRGPVGSPEKVPLSGRAGVLHQFLIPIDALVMRGTHFLLVSGARAAEGRS